MNNNTATNTATCPTVRKQIGKTTYVDADDAGNGSYARIRKDSFYWYKQVIANNGLPDDTDSQK